MDERTAEVSSHRTDGEVKDDRLTVSLMESSARVVVDVTEHRPLDATDPAASITAIGDDLWFSFELTVDDVETMIKGLSSAPSVDVEVNGSVTDE